MSDSLYNSSNPYNEIDSYNGPNFIVSGKRAYIVGTNSSSLKLANVRGHIVAIGSKLSFITAGLVASNSKPAFIYGTPSKYASKDAYIAAPDTSYVPTAGAIRLDRTKQQRVEIPYSSSYANLTGLTINMWVRMEMSNDGANYFGILEEAYGGVPRIGIYMPSTSNKFYVGVNSGSFNGVLSNITFVVDRWYMLTMTWDGSLTKLYINGQFDNSVSQIGTVLVDAAQPIYLGYRPITGAYTSVDIDNLEIYNYPFTPSEIASLYAANISQVKFAYINGVSNFKIKTSSKSVEIQAPFVSSKSCFVSGVKAESSKPCYLNGGVSEEFILDTEIDINDFGQMTLDTAIILSANVNAVPRIVYGNVVYPITRTLRSEQILPTYWTPRNKEISKSAFLNGGLTAIATKSSYIHVASSYTTTPKRCFISGPYVSLTVVKPSFVAGPPEVFKQCFIAGREFTNANSTKWMHISYVQPQISTTKSCYVNSIGISDSSKFIYLSGQRTGSAIKAAWVSGPTVSTIKTSKLGYTFGHYSNTLNKSGFTFGHLQIDSNKAAYIPVINFTTSNKNSFVNCPVPYSNFQIGYLKGHGVISSGHSAFIYCELFASNTKSSFVYGRRQFESARYGYIVSTGNISSSKNNYVAGNVGLSATKNSYIEGSGLGSSKICIAMGCGESVANKLSYIFSVGTRVGVKWSYVGGPGITGSKLSFITAGTPISSNNKNSYIGGS